MIADYLVHFLVEVVGQVVLWIAYSHKRVRNPRAIWNDLCHHPWHRPAIWLSLTMATSVATVHIAG